MSISQSREIAREVLRGLRHSTPQATVRQIIGPMPDGWTIRYDHIEQGDLFPATIETIAAVIRYHARPAREANGE